MPRTQVAKHHPATCDVVHIRAPGYELLCVSGGTGMSSTRANRSRLFTAAAVCLALALLCRQPLAAQAQETDQPGCVERDSPLVDTAGRLAIAAHVDSAPLRDIWHWGAVPIGIAVGPEGTIYWSQYRTNTIARADAKKKKPETFAVVDGPLGLAFDQTNRNLFYVSDRHYPRSIGVLRPGAKPEMLVCGAEVNRPLAITLAENSRRLYWTESINGRIRSAGTDGRYLSTSFDDGIANTDERPGAVALASAGITVDEPRGLIFWSDLRSATIVRVRLDGSEPRTILDREQGLVFPTGLAIDSARGKLYWADPGTETIGSSDLSGLNAEVVASAADGVLEPYGLAIDPTRRLLYWTDLARNAIYRAGLDEKRVELFISLDAPSAPAPPAPATTSACDQAVARAQPEFLRRWFKLVRTCVIGANATKAVMRAPYDLKVPAGTCVRQLRLTRDLASLRAQIEPHCDAKQIEAAIDDTLDLGAEIVATDLPHAALVLQSIRPYVGGVALAWTAGADEALVALDGLVGRLDRLAAAPKMTIQSSLPVSGQVTSYAAATQFAGGATVVPDDGTLRAGSPLAYADNGDGTITDRNTGLTWEKKCDGCEGLHDFNTRYPWRSRKGEVDVPGWLRALNAENGVGFAGHSDWRLPEIGELVSIINYETFNPAVSSAFDGAGCGLDCGSLTAPECSCSRFGAYWTSGSSPHPADVIPTVTFNLGLVVGESTTESAFVRAVRGPQTNSSGRFIDNGDGTVTDRATRLVWEKKCNCPGDLHDAERRMHWSFDGKQETIWDWVRAVNGEGGQGFAGHDDWRIPNVKELFSLFDGAQRDPSIAPLFARQGCADIVQPRCSTTQQGLHWTSTTLADFPALAIAVGFSTPGELERDPPAGVLRVVGGVEPHEKTLRMVTRAVRGPIDAAP